MNKHSLIMPNLTQGGSEENTVQKVLSQTLSVEPIVTFCIEFRAMVDRIEFSNWAHFLCHATAIWLALTGWNEGLSKSARSSSNALPPLTIKSYWFCKILQTKINSLTDSCLGSKCRLQTFPRCLNKYFRTWSNILAIPEENVSQTWMFEWVSEAFSQTLNNCNFIYHCNDP